MSPPNLRCFEEGCFSHLSLLGVALIFDELQACRHRCFALRLVGFAACEVRREDKLQLTLTPSRIQSTGTI